MRQILLLPIVKRSCKSDFSCLVSIKNICQFKKKRSVEMEINICLCANAVSKWLRGSLWELACRWAMFKLMRAPVLAVALCGCKIAQYTLGLCRQPLHASCLETWPVCRGTGSWQREGRRLFKKKKNTQGSVSGYSLLLASHLCQLNI